MRRIIILLLLLPLPALAQTSPSSGNTQTVSATPAASSKEPIAIDAAGSLVWQQSDKTYHAIGDASATRGMLNVKGDELIAHYVEQNGQNEVQFLEANGHVIINDNGTVATAPHGQYNMVTGDMDLIGQDLHITDTKNETLSANQHLQFNDKTGKAFAQGNPVMTRPDRKLVSDKLDGQFKKDETGNWQLQTGTAIGHVVITTGIGTPNPSVSMSDNAFYDAEHNTALLTGNVRLTRGQNQMNGDRAEIDMNTGLSRLLPSADANSPDHRVRAILYQNK
jgi:lipopolysaccharide export system protein LptA